MHFFFKITPFCLSKSLTTACQDKTVSKQLGLMIDRWQLNSLLHQCHLEFFFSCCCFVAVVERFQPTKLLICVTWKSYLLGLNIGIMHRRGNQELSSQDPLRLIRGLWHGCQNTDRLFNQCAQLNACTHTHIQPHSCEHTCMYTQNHRDRLFYQLHSSDWHLFSWVSFKLPTLKDTTMWHCRLFYNTSISKSVLYFFLMVFVAKYNMFWLSDCIIQCIHKISA